ncbi:hypothetical protein D9M71_570980 [compost metagenome]
MHLLKAPAAAHATHRAGVKVIQPHRQLQVPLRARQLVSHIKAVPGAIEPRLGPCMAGQMLALFAEQITRYITCRHPLATCTSQERMGMVLAHTCAPGEGLGRTGVHLRGARRVGHVLVERLHQIDQGGTALALATLLGGKAAQRLVGFGQAGKAQKWQGRLAFSLGLACFIDIDLAAGADDDRVMGLVQGQHMQNVAERVHLCAYRARQVELPTQYLLALAVVRRQTQILDAGAYLVFIVVGGFVANSQSHAASR